MVRTIRKIKIKKEKITYCILIPFRIIPHLSLLTASEILLAVHVQGVTICFSRRRVLPVQLSRIQTYKAALDIQ